MLANIEISTNYERITYYDQHEAGARPLPFCCPLFGTFKGVDYRCQKEHTFAKS